MRLDGRFSEIFRCGEDSDESKRIRQILAAVFSSMVGGIVVALFMPILQLSGLVQQ